MLFTLAQQAVSKPLTAFWIILGYLALLLCLGLFSSRFFRGTSKDYFVASRSIGPFILLMSVFGTTMTGFALVGSTAQSYQSGIGVYGLMASWSGLIHSAVFFLVGVKLWAIGKRYGYVTQVQFFRDRFESDALGYVLFVILVLLVIPYLLVGIIAACKTMQPITAGMFPDVFSGALNEKTGKLMFAGALPPWLTGLAVCAVVLCYVFGGGVRSAAWANTFQTIVFMIMGVVAFYMIANSDKLGGLRQAYELTKQHAPDNLTRARIRHAQFFSYLFIPLSVGMFPHLFQHWLTARSAKTFRLTVVAHPLFIMIVWVPCVLIGAWAAGLAAAGQLKVPDPNAALGRMVSTLVDSPWLTGLLTAGILAAIMSSLDSQFVCLGSMFTHDIVVHRLGENHFSDRQTLWLGRGFVVIVVAAAYALSMLFLKTNVFALGVWCFSGFASLFPLVFAAIYWRRTTRAGAWACVLTTLVVWSVLFGLDMTQRAAQRAAGDVPQDLLIGGMMPVTLIFAASTVSLVMVSLLTSPPTPKTVARFFPDALTGAPH